MLLPLPIPTAFTPLLAICGGLLIGAASALLWIGIGRIAGVSGIASGLIRPFEQPWQLAFTAGLLLPGLLARILGIAPHVYITTSFGLLIGGGLLVGIGSGLAGGCTSGHGICGMSRLSPRSLVATFSFMGIAFVVVFLTRGLGIL